MPAPSRSVSGRKPTRWLPSIWLFLAAARSRRALRRLDDRLLSDIGLTRAEAVAEARRPLWDAPLHWRG
ncbi:MAG: hypothetical protein B7Z10_02335 [Rhodobacterales bacterium 32-66-7]|nr:MAG: hypothetical protein B7Z31_07945 [Rhodobacterales bacterium 12-65-15]OYX26767.1 MAG: hypothetical protein B7Z10_02335 [Rhodobacterales bacterium 32-66-7]OZA17824.1 MAG: hypothetical protein B7Y02_02200 [Rhodobacterales bacterium 17-64-5]